MALANANPSFLLDRAGFTHIIGENQTPASHLDEGYAVTPLVK
jgi:hypothetical protein